MPKSWRDIRREAVDERRINEQGVAKHRERLEGELVAHRLAEIRQGDMRVVASIGGDEIALG